MKHPIRSSLALLMILCMLVPLFALSVFAMDAYDDLLPIEEAPISSRDARALSSGLSDDPYSDRQWNLEMIGAAEAWRSGLTGKGVRVAVIDSGVSTQTNDFDSGRLLPGRNTAAAGESTEDTGGHGTLVAGIIGATKDNGVGIAGVAPEVTIIPIKTFTETTVHVGAVESAFYAAVDEFHCDIINYSYGIKTDSQAYHDMVKYAVSKGVIVICSAGNEGSSTLHYPASYDEVIAVGSVNKDMECSSFSQHNSSVFVTAPGEKIVSLGTESGSMRTASGTSLSAPHVAGMAALLKQAHPEMTSADFREILKMSCRDLGDEGYDEYYGWGLIQVPEAMQAADEYFQSHEPDTPETPDPTPDPGTPGSGSSPFNISWLRTIIRNLISSIVKNLFHGIRP